jgi:hypothetical protein
MLRRALLTTFVLAAFGAAGARAQSEDDGASRRLTSAVSYIAFPTMTVGVMAQARATGALVIDMGLDIPDAALRARVQAMQPRLIDAFRTTLSNYATAYYRDRTAPDPTLLARLMQTTVDRTLGRPGARFLIANIIYQRR